MKTRSVIFILIILCVYKIEIAESKDVRYLNESLNKNQKPIQDSNQTNAVKLLPEMTAVQNDSTSLKRRGIFELGYQAGTGEFGLNRIMANFMMSFPLNPNFSMGIGIGFRYYREEDDGQLVLPVYADFRANLTESSVAPFISFKVGYSFYTDYGINGLGLLLFPSAGVRFGNKNPVHLGIGYEMQSMEFYGFYSSSKRREFSGAFALFLGITF